MPVSRTTGGKARMVLSCWDNRRQLSYFYTRKIPNLTKTEPLTYVLCGCLRIWPQSVRIKLFKTSICPVTREMALVLCMQRASTPPPTTVWCTQSTIWSREPPLCHPFQNIHKNPQLAWHPSLSVRMPGWALVISVFVLCSSVFTAHRPCFLPQRTANWWISNSVSPCGRPSLHPCKFHELPWQQKTLRRGCRLSGMLSEGLGTNMQQRERGKTALYPRHQWEYVETEEGVEVLHSSRKGNALWKCQLSWGDTPVPEEELINP